MNILSYLCSPEPHDLWTILIDWIQGGVGNLGWALLILTLLVKIATLPLDLMVKYTSKKQTLIQQKCAPQVAKLQKKFGNDKQRLQVQTQALYKHEGLKAGTSCLVMLVNLVLTCTIFFSFYGTLRDVSASNAIKQYEQVVDASNEQLYQSIIDYSGTDSITNKETADAWFEEYKDLDEYVNDAETDRTTTEYQEKIAKLGNYEIMLDKATKESKEAAVEKWKEVKSSWLWVQNIWVADATTRPFPTYDSLVKIAENAGDEYAKYVEKNISKSDYNKIAGVLSAKDVKYNGFYILAILAGVITFLSQFISELHNKFRNKKANIVVKQANPQAATTMKLMKIIMPIIMIMFVLTSSASFGIYLLASNVATIATGELVNFIVNKMTKKKRLEIEAELEKEADRLIRKGKLQG